MIDVYREVEKMIEQMAYDHTKYFAEECGVRLAGTEAVIKASDYILDYYKQHGIKTEIHEFDVPICKVIESNLKANIGGKWSELGHTPALFSKSTAKGGETFPLVFLEDGSTAAFEENDVKGKAVLIYRDVYFVYPDISMYKKLKEYGAAAVIYTTGEFHMDVPYVYANFETMDEDYTIPTAVIYYQTARELLKQDVKEIFMNLQFDVAMSTSRNTIGVIEGALRPEENVIICGHLDSSMGSVGATDDAAAVAAVMELARYYQQLADAGKPPARTMRFIAWSGHECGLHGSKYYLLEHLDIFENTKFVLNYDVIGNDICSYAAIGGCMPEVESKLNEIMEEQKLKWPVIMEPQVVDALNFAAKEIAQITLFADVVRGNHTVYDNMDLISVKGFKRPIAFSKAVLDWAAGDVDIIQGYPSELTRAMKETSEMYGWGLFGLV